MGLQENFRRTAPDYNRARDAVLFCEFPDIVLDLQRQVIFCACLFYVRAAKFLHIILVEGRLHRTDFAQELLYLGQMFRPEHGRVFGRLIRCVRENIPSSEHDIFEFLQRHEVLNRRRASVGPLSQANRAELRQRSHRLRLFAADQVDPGHERSCHGSHSYGEYSKFSFWRSNSRKPAHSFLSCVHESVWNNEITSALNSRRDSNFQPLCANNVSCANTN